MWRSLRLALAVALLGTAGSGAPDFSYDRGAPLALETTHTTHSGQVESSDLSFAAGGRRVTATLVRPLGRGRHAGLLFVHWLGDPKTTNRTEFLPDAFELARHGATALLVDAMWAQPGWFDTRSTSGDYAASVAQVVALRRALDVLAAQPDVDPARIAFVGHDFGAMYGALVAGCDPRPRAYVFMTPTVTFWEWYLLGERPVDKYTYIEQMRPLDTTNWLARATFGAALLQFGKRDAYVPAAAAREFASALPPDRDTTVKTYDADHDLGIDAARSDRLQWLIGHLALR